MNTDLAGQIAEKIVSEAIIENWKFYILVILLSGIGSYFASLIKGYANKRGENLATKADFNDLMAKLKESTETTEQIKHDIEHHVWRKQQIEELRRKKLEEFLIHIYVVKEQLMKEVNNLYFGTTGDIDIFASNKAIMIRLLYFPELATEHGNFLQMYVNFRKWIGEGMTENASGTISQEHRNKLATHISSLETAISRVELKAAEMAKNWNVV
ncbi:MAG: hypothetical protein ACR65R_18895 [Methylomicrobium sp.]